MIKMLYEIAKDDVATVGGKAANLGELFGTWPVPNGFVVTTKAYRTFVEMQELKHVIAEQLKALDMDDPEILEKISGELTQMILDAEVFEELRKEISASLAQLSGEKFAVRSSATAEDLLEASFAGQQDTYLNVEKKDVIDSVKKCWASLFNPRAIYYRHEKNIPHEVEMAVVVQEMVDADFAGVMFTLDPFRKKYILIEAATGLGEQVVSGEVTPSSFMLDKSTYEIVEKSSPYPISEEIVKQIAKLGVIIEAHYGCPQDIEFAVKDSSVFVLQSRALTVL